MRHAGQVGGSNLDRQVAGLLPDLRQVAPLASIVQRKACLNITVSKSIELKPVVKPG